MEAFVIPFIGMTVTVASVIGIAIALFVGYLIGNQIKSLAKIILVVFGILALLFVIGILSKDILDKMKELIDFFKPMFSGLLGSATSVTGSGGIPLMVIALVVGVILGWRK